MKIEKVKITPAQAREWLEQRPEKQRNINPMHVAKLRSAIENNEWRENGATIIFDTKGQLIDGQHRLQAIVESKRTVYSLVVWNVSANDETFQTIDDCRARKVHDFLGCKNSSAVAAAAIILRSVLLDGDYYPKDKAPIVDTIKAITPYIPVLEPIIVEVSPAGKVMGQGSFLAFLALYHRHIQPVKDQDRLTEFFARLGDGAGLQHGNPILTLRNRFMAIAKHERLDRKVTRCLIVKAFNAFMRGQEMKRVNWDPMIEKVPALYSDAEKKAKAS